ncbi:hypothetical protein BCR39DRAFT_550917 [Naematelia encephala]|uniref:Inositol polyphosphate-related phosphatase domain-containing protein n=1 Tax=Naematelia encephala TaxID=71784 RepID=A0A1Y2AJL6_9TREE|nr:hypothetical protein BCR39DRAFT_550917 [Naematelia encephala]
MSSLAGPSFKAETSAPSPTSAQDEGSHVLSRLHALFSPSASHSNDSPGIQPHHGRPLSPSRGGKGEDLARMRTEPIMGRSPSPMVDTPPEPDRQAIKVFVVTWNMGDALPKGDLKVLFGEVPQYTPPPNPPTGLPDLPTESAHPYHIVVVAGQECPTHSGVPRGLAGGLMKGVRGAGHRKHTKDGLDIAEADKEATSGDSADGASDDEEVAAALIRSQASSPNPPHTPVLHRHGHPGSKGWSTMLDDWFCGPALPTTANTPSGAAFASPQESPSPFNSAPPGASSLQPPNLLRSSSAPASPTLSPLPLHTGRSPLARTQSSSDTSNSDTSSDGFEITKSNSVPVKPKMERPDIIIPNDEPNRTGGGSGCYLHVVKERLMGMYLSVYVYKGCEHLVQGVDKDFVTAGLAGGRFGNKGGIGISLKLADHRFLFVNSHLAAHTGRISTRLANIAKIKTDLRLDCFLPPDDPRADAEDITERFDTVFWCGDLNFRLELSRLHAEWLVEHKDFAEALRWDQLRNVMRDPDANPFPGFEEHVINFPPTFKYDVWKSIKATNRELRRSLRRRPSNAKQPFEAASSMPGLSHVAEAHHEDSEVAAEAVTEEPAGDEPDDGTDVASRRSFDSAGLLSTAGTDVDDDDDLVLGTVDPSSYGSRHKAFEVAVKSKTKQLLSLVKMDGILTPSSSKKRLSKRSSQKMLRNKRSTEFDPYSRRTSVSSMHSSRVEAEVEESQPRTSTSTYMSIDQPRRPSDASTWMSSPPTRPAGRKLSVLKRTMSGRSDREDADGASTPHVDDWVDHREGVYDSSKKQRVPSWCDRVLWKAHIVPDLDHEVERDASVSDSSHKAFPRLSNVFTNISGHLRVGLTRSATIEPAQVDRVRISSPLPPTPPPEPEPEPLVASPDASTELFKTPSNDGLVPAPRPRKPPLAPHLVTRARSGSGPRHPLTDATSVPPSPPAEPLMTFDAASPATVDRAPTSNLRPRSNSDTVPPNPRTILKSSPSFPPRSVTSGEKLHHTPPPSHTQSSKTVPTRRSQTTFAEEPVRSPPHDDKNAFMAFIRGLPHLLHHKSSTMLPPQSPSTGHLQQRRHQQGEVVCLHYGTIDDAGMRVLEGRSDHRPAIFAAAVYV